MGVYLKRSEQSRGGRGEIAGRGTVWYTNTQSRAIGKMFNVSDCLSIIFTRGDRRILDGRFRFLRGRFYRIEHVRK